MPSYHELVGEEPTHELAEALIQVVIRELKYDRALYSNSRVTGYTEITLERLGYPRNRQAEKLSALQHIIKHFPSIILKGESSVYINDSTKHLLNANDLLIMDYYLLLLNEYEERVNKYQRYLKKQQDRQRNKLLLVLFLPFILFILMILVGD